MLDVLDLQMLLGLFYDGGDGGGNPPPTSPAPTPPAPGSNDDPTRTFKQSELDHIMAERGRQGGESAVKKLLTDLGIEKADDLKAIIQKARDAESAGKTELQKAKDDLAAANTQIETLKNEKQSALAQATERLLKAAVLAEAGKEFDATELNSVWMALQADAALKGKIKPKDDGESFEGIADVLKDIAKAHPRWLRDKSGGIGTPRPGATGKQPPAAGQGSGSGEQDLAKQTERQYRHTF